MVLTKQMGSKMQDIPERDLLAAVEDLEGARGGQPINELSVGERPVCARAGITARYCCLDVHWYLRR